MGEIFSEIKDIDFKKVILYVLLPTLLIAGFFTVPVESKEIEFPAELYVSNKTQFVDIRHIEEKKDTVLNFGGVSTGYKVHKSISLNMAQEAPPADVDFKIEGKIKDFIEIKKDGENVITGFVITEPSKVTVTANVPEGTIPDEYYGKVRVIYSKTLFRKLVNKFID